MTRFQGQPRTRRTLLWTASTLSVLAVIAGAIIIQRVPREIMLERVEDLPVPLNEAQSLFETPIERVAVKDAQIQKIVAAAHAQEGDEYDASYRRISYPNGDVPKGSGACTDVVVRSLRGAGIDLQSLVHKDITAHFSTYSDRWHLGHPDTNIDHRRVPNLMVFFKRHGRSLPLGTKGNDLQTWKPGDIVCWKIPGNRWHTGVVSDGVGTRGLPLVVHNGWVCIEQDVLDKWPVIGHYRLPVSKTPTRNL